MSDIVERLRDTACYELPDDWEIYADTPEVHHEMWRQGCCTADCGDIEEAADEIERLRAFVDNITDALGPYPDLDGHRIVRDAYAALRSAKRDD